MLPIHTYLYLIRTFFLLVSADTYYGLPIPARGIPKVYSSIYYKFLKLGPDIVNKEMGLLLHGNQTAATCLIPCLFLICVLFRTGICLVAACVQRCYVVVVENAQHKRSARIVLCRVCIQNQSH